MPFFATVLRFLSSFLDLLIPPRKTQQLLLRTPAEVYGSLANRHTAVGGAVYILPYKDPRVTALIWELKYHRNDYAASVASGLLREEILGIASESLDTPYLLPVPMYIEKKKQRGYNQTELLCEKIVSSLENVAYYAPTLERIRATHPQQGLSKEKRLHNVEHSVSAHGDVLGKTCIVIDDVLTTGATLHECRRALRKAGAAQVHLLSLAG